MVTVVSFPVWVLVTLACIVVAVLAFWVPLWLKELFHFRSMNPVQRAEHERWREWDRRTRREQRASLGRFLSRVLKIVVKRRHA